jgi:radical SAM superfamily enzyme YgiQ (UPF0313 family)
MEPKLLLINPAMSTGNPLRAGPGSSQRPLAAPSALARQHRQANAGGLVTMEPLALAYVAALTPPHWQVRIVDEVLDDIPAGYVPDLVGLSSLTITAPRAYQIASWYRDRGIPVVMGGVHATLCPDEAGEYVDAVYLGEAERGWPQVIADFEEGRLQRRYNAGASSLQDLPRPRRGLYEHHYRLNLVSASRGCRYRCEFCTLWKLDGGRYRARPPEAVWRELEEMPDHRPTLFTDENVFTERDWAVALFQGMADRGLRRPYAVQASLNVADDAEMLAALKGSGCMTVLIGFESVSEQSLRIMRKGVNLKIGVDHYQERIDRLHDQGLAVSGTFMFGNDGDQPDIFERTVEFVLDTGLDLAHFGLLTPYPGTDLYDRLARENRLLYTDFPQDYARYDLHTAVFRPREMTAEQLEEGLQWATRQISSWPMTARRAWSTWSATGNLWMTALTLVWNRSGLYHRVVSHRDSKGRSSPKGPRESATIAAHSGENRDR